MPKIYKAQNRVSLPGAGADMGFMTRDRRGHGAIQRRLNWSLLTWFKRRPIGLSVEGYDIESPGHRLRAEYWER